MLSHWLRNGHLKMETERRRASGYWYTRIMIITQNKKHGTIED